MINVLYAGSPDVSRNVLMFLLENERKFDFKIVGVLSNPPTAKGRHKELIPTPVAEEALKQNIPVFTPEHLDGECREMISKINPDLLICFAYGHIFGTKFLEMFKYGGINIHPSLLPKYRGCTPVPACILNLDKQTAVTIQTLSLKMDEGDILAQEIIELTGNETTESLLCESAEKGAKLILPLFKEINETESIPKGQPQQGNASYTGIITKSDSKIDWNLSSKKIDASVRAYFSEPGAWTTENNLTLKIIETKLISSAQIDGYKYKDETAGKVVDFNKKIGIIVKTGDGIIGIVRLQRQGKKIMNSNEFMNGARDFIGTLLA